MITICYVTARVNNNFNWFWDGLLAQYKMHLGTDIELIVIDLWKNERDLDLTNDCNIATKHISPLPSPWQGENQISREMWFACANTRNTGFVYAKYDYIAFCDDLTVLDSNWFDALIEGYNSNSIILGSYQKALNVKVENGKLLSCDIESSDPRLYLLAGQTRKEIDGGNLFGCSFAMPVQKGLEVNGFDCLTDSIGYEDQVFGERIKKTGVKFIYDKRLFTTESNDNINENTIIKRHDPMLGFDKYMEILNRFGIRQSVYPRDANKDCSHIIVEVAKTLPPKAVYNFFSLKELRERVKAGETISITDMNYPLNTWYDNKHISEY